MEVVLIIVGLVLIIVGIIGCIIPGLPGPPIAYLSLILLQFTEHTPYSWTFMLIWLLIVIGVTLLDFYVPAWGTKKFGGSRYGTWGSIIGLIFGLFFVPFGIIIGPFLGAFLGELISGKPSNEAFRSGFGAFVGFLAGTIMKLGVTFIIGFYFVLDSWQIIASWF